MYTIEYNSAIIKQEILSFETTWMNLEKNMLNEIRHRQKNTILSHYE